MIELVVASRCTHCNRCVQVCPTHVFEAVVDQPPRIARQMDCQTCNLCELYCPADALYVHPNCEQPIHVQESEVVHVLGEFRRQSGWDEWASDPAYTNQHHRMADIFAQAAAWHTQRQG